MVAAMMPRAIAAPVRTVASLRAAALKGYTAAGARAPGRFIVVHLGFRDWQIGREARRPVPVPLPSKHGGTAALPRSDPKRGAQAFGECNEARGGLAGEVALAAALKGPCRSRQEAVKVHMKRPLKVSLKEITPTEYP
jgi:hypothetical protein